METNMNLEKYKAMKKANTKKEEKKLKNMDIDALIKKKLKSLQIILVVNLEITIRIINTIMKKTFMNLDIKLRFYLILKSIFT